MKAAGMSLGVRYQLALRLVLAACVVLSTESGSRGSPATATVRIAAAQPRNRTIEWKINDAEEVLRQVGASLSQLEQLVHKAGEAKCDAIAFPEDTLGLGKWEAAHPQQLKGVVPRAVAQMLERLGRTAAEHR